MGERLRAEHESTMAELAKCQAELAVAVKRAEVTKVRSSTGLGSRRIVKFESVCMCQQCTIHEPTLKEGMTCSGGCCGRNLS